MTGPLARRWLRLPPVRSDGIPTGSRSPLVSVLVVCKDAGRTIRRAIESLLAQDLTDVEIVVQDGLSTDGTREILSEYGDRLRVVSEPDAGQNDAFVRGLRRCRGEFVAFCWADEELLPHALRFGVDRLEQRPEIAAIYGNFLETDLDGRGDVVSRPHPWSLERVFTWEFVPPVCSSLFRRRAIEEGYLPIADFGPDCTEYVLWVGVGSRGRVEYVDETLARYARHTDQLSMQVDRVSAYPTQVGRAIDCFAASALLPEAARARASRARAHVHVWAAQWLFCSCRDATAAARHLHAALAGDPEPGHLTMVVLECLKQALREDRSGDLFGLLDDLHGVERSPAGFELCRALAFHRAERTTEAQAAITTMRSRPHRAQLFDLATPLVEDLSRLGLRADAERVLDILGALARSDARAYYPLAIVLANLQRPRDAYRMAECHRAAYPADPATRSLLGQLALLVCVSDAACRAELASFVGRPSLERDDALPFADAIFRCLANHEAARTLSPSGRQALHTLTAPFRRAALRAELLDLASELGLLGDRLAAAAPP